MKRMSTHVVHNLKGLRARCSCNRNKNATVVRIGEKYQTKSDASKMGRGRAQSIQDIFSKG
jgi:hypothetical protein